jgi:hypothetical protein
MIGVAACTAMIVLTYNHQGQSPVFSGPFFSGAANLDPLRPFDWRVCLDQLAEFRDLDEKQADDFRFAPCADPYKVEFNEIGFLWVSYAARSLFPWMSDRQAVITLQLAVHFVVSLMTMTLLASKRARVAFIFLYALNPVVLYFAQFPYRYFWACVASFIFLFSVYRVSWRRITLGMATLLSPALFFTRQTLLPLELLTFARLATIARWYIVFIAFVVFFTSIALAPKITKGPWHTIYIGVGAYDNPYMSGLSDNNGYALYERSTGRALKLSSPDDNYYQRDTYEDYQQVLKVEVMRIAEERPLMFVRNAILNALQSFSVGHPVGRPILAYISAAIGFVVIATLLLSRQYWLFLGIGAVSVGYTPYYPPIPAYMFGAYILIAFGIAKIAEARPR